MHELGLVFQIAKTLNRVAESEGLSEIAAVVVEIGEVSGVVPKYLSDAWLYFSKKEPLLRECELKIETLEAVTYCENCEQTYRTIDYGKTCPYCHSGKTYLLSGNEFNIKEITAR